MDYVYENITNKIEMQSIFNQLYNIFVSKTYLLGYCNSYNHQSIKCNLNIDNNL